MMCPQDEHIRVGVLPGVGFMAHDRLCRSFVQFWNVTWQGRQLKRTHRQTGTGGFVRDRLEAD